MYSSVIACTVVKMHLTKYLEEKFVVYINSAMLTEEVNVHNKLPIMLMCHFTINNWVDNNLAIFYHAATHQHVGQIIVHIVVLAGLLMLTTCT